MASVICPAQIDVSNGQSPALLLSTDKFPLSLYNVKKKTSVPKALFISCYMFSLCAKRGDKYNLSISGQRVFFCPLSGVVSAGIQFFTVLYTLI